MRCWYCGEEKMVEAPDLGSAWFKCSECGATWTRVPKPSQAAADEIFVLPSGERVTHIKAKAKRRKVTK